MEYKPISTCGLLFFAIETGYLLDLVKSLYKNYYR